MSDSRDDSNDEVVEVTTTQLPGVGHRHELTTSGGDVLGVVRHRDGDRELIVFSADDRDSCRLSLRLRGEEARRVAAMLGEGSSDRRD